MGGGRPGPGRRKAGTLGRSRGRRPDTGRRCGQRLAVAFGETLAGQWFTATLPGTPSATGPRRRIGSPATRGQALESRTPPLPLVAGRRARGVRGHHWIVDVSCNPDTLAEAYPHNEPPRALTRCMTAGYLEARFRPPCPQVQGPCTGCLDSGAGAQFPGSRRPFPGGAKPKRLIVGPQQRNGVPDDMRPVRRSRQSPRRATSGSSAGRCDRGRFWLSPAG